MDALVENIFNLSGLNLIIWSMYAGIILATLYSYYQKRIIGGFVQHMMKNGANSIDNAKTLEELGYHHHAAIRRELTKPAPLRKMVWEVDDNHREGEDGVIFCAREKALDLNLGRFYIPEEKRIEAELRYATHDNDLFAVIISIVVFFVLSVLACAFLPTLMENIKLF